MDSDDLAVGAVEVHGLAANVGVFEQEPQGAIAGGVDSHGAGLYPNTRETGVGPVAPGSVFEAARREFGNPHDRDPDCDYSRRL